MILDSPYKSMNIVKQSFEHIWPSLFSAIDSGRSKKKNRKAPVVLLKRLNPDDIDRLTSNESSLELKSKKNWKRVILSDSESDTETEKPLINMPDDPEPSSNGSGNVDKRVLERLIGTTDVIKALKKGSALENQKGLENIDFNQYFDDEQNDSIMFIENEEREKSPEGVSNRFLALNDDDDYPEPSPLSANCGSDYEYSQPKEESNDINNKKYSESKEGSNDIKNEKYFQPKEKFDDIGKHKSSEPDYSSSKKLCPEPSSKHSSSDVKKHRSSEREYYSKKLYDEPSSKHSSSDVEKRKSSEREYYSKKLYDEPSSNHSSSDVEKRKNSEREDSSSKIYDEPSSKHSSSGVKKRKSSEYEYSSSKIYDEPSSKHSSSDVKKRKNSGESSSSKKLYAEPSSKHTSLDVKKRKNFDGESSSSKKLYVEPSSKQPSDSSKPSKIDTQKPIVESATKSEKDEREPKSTRPSKLSRKNKSPKRSESPIDSVKPVKNSQTQTTLEEKDTLKTIVNNRDVTPPCVECLKRKKVESIFEDVLNKSEINQLKENLGDKFFEDCRPVYSSLAELNIRLQKRKLNKDEEFEKEIQKVKEKYNKVFDEIKQNLKVMDELQIDLSQVIKEQNLGIDLDGPGESKSKREELRNKVLESCKVFLVEKETNEPQSSKAPSKHLEDNVAVIDEKVVSDVTERNLSIPEKKSISASNFKHELVNFSPQLKDILLNHGIRDSQGKVKSKNVFNKKENVIISPAIPKSAADKRKPTVVTPNVAILPILNVPDQQPSSPQYSGPALPSKPPVSDASLSIEPPMPDLKIQKVTQPKIRMIKEASVECFGAAPKVSVTTAETTSMPVLVLPASVNVKRSVASGSQLPQIVPTPIENSSKTLHYFTNNPNTTIKRIVNVPSTVSVPSAASVPSTASMPSIFSCTPPLPTFVSNPERSAPPPYRPKVSQNSAVNQNYPRVSQNHLQIPMIPPPHSLRGSFQKSKESRHISSSTKDIRLRTITPDMLSSSVGINSSTQSIKKPVPTAIRTSNSLTIQSGQQQPMTFIVPNSVPVSEAMGSLFILPNQVTSTQGNMNSVIQASQVESDIPGEIMDSDEILVQNGNVASSAGQLNASVGQTSTVAPNVTFSTTQKPTTSSVPIARPSAPPAKTTAAEPGSACFICGLPGEIVCCGRFVYCNAKCRLDDWFRHKDECSAF